MPKPIRRRVSNPQSLAEKLAQRELNRRWYDERCVICQNEGGHDIEDRPHVMEGQE